MPRAKQRTKVVGKSSQEKPAEADVKQWEVKGHTIKLFKTFIFVKVGSAYARKFLFSEWQSADISKKMAEHFAITACKHVLNFNMASTRRTS